MCVLVLRLRILFSFLRRLTALTFGQYLSSVSSAEFTLSLSLHKDPKIAFIINSTNSREKYFLVPSVTYMPNGLTDL